MDNQKDKKGKPKKTDADNRGRGMLARCIALVTVFFVAAAALGMRLSQLQVDEASEWEALASRQQLANVPIEAARGNIYDSNGKLLAQSAAVWTVEASPDVLNRSKVSTSSTEREAARVAARELARILELDEETLYTNLSNKDKMYYKIKAKIEKPVADEIRAMCKEYNIGGIFLQEDTKRYYPYESLAATVLGFVGADNNGLEGLERWYDETMAGTPGRSMSVIDARGNAIATGGEGTTYPAEDGNSIVLTLDIEMQRSVEKYLEQAVNTHNAAQRGFAIVMDVNTGAILALAVSPSYNPNTPYDIQDPAILDTLEMLPDGSRQKAEIQTLARTLQWRNKALADTYEPGSVLKIITAAAALDSGAYAQDSMFYCNGTTMVEGWPNPMGCAGDPPTRHGQLSLREALIHSCNVSFINMSAGMGVHTWYNYLRAFGLTEPTGIDLPGEPSQAAINNLIYSENQMGPVELASCSFGQSNKYTAVQMIAAVSAAVNGGNLMQPYIVDRELDADGNVVKQYGPVNKRQVISPETSAQICEILEDLVTNTANGQYAYAAGYRIGGKSGTSQKLDDEREDVYVSSFLGFAPADDPQIAVLLALDEPQDNSGRGNYFGGRLAGPSVREILRECLTVMGIDPVYETGDELARTTVQVPKCVDQDLGAAQTALNAQNLTYHVVGGGGTVTGQFPQAYSQIPYGGVVVLYTDPSMPQETVTVPDLVGRTSQSAIELLRGLGLNVLTTGAPDSSAGVVVISQDVEAGTVVPRGTVVTLVMENKNQQVE